MELIDGINGPGDGLGPRQMSGRIGLTVHFSSCRRCCQVATGRGGYPFDPADNANEIFP